MTVNRAGSPQARQDKTRGDWYFAFDSVQKHPDGSRRQVKRRGFATKTAAKNALKAARAEDEALAGKAAPTIDDILDEFIGFKRLQGRAPNTIEFYNWSAGLARARWGGWRADEVTHQHLEAAYLEMLSGGRRDKPMKPRAVEALHKTLKAAYALAINRRQVLANPCALVALPSSDVEPAHAWWTPEQVGEFLSFVHALEDETSGAPMPGRQKGGHFGLPLPIGMIDVLIDTGGRRGEVVGLRWADVDLEAGTAKVSEQIATNSRTKELSRRRTKRPRSKSTIALHPETVVELARRRKQQAAERLLIGPGWPKTNDPINGDLVFTNAAGLAIHPDTVTKIVARLTVRCGLPRLTPHGLRHSFATAALTARIPVEVVAARLGNTPRVVQETYAHVIPADDAAAAQVVGDLYRSANS